MLKVRQSISKMGWHLNVPAIERAINQLDIERDVIVTFDPRLRRRGLAGLHRYSQSADCHVVLVDETRSADVANGALWHELTHAMQAERYAKLNQMAIADFSKTYDNNNINYWNNPYEIEARRIALQNQKNGAKLVLT